jgi:hypothetical protein
MLTCGHYHGGSAVADPHRPLKVDGMNMPGDERDHALLTAL